MLTTSRPANSRLIGEQLFDEITKGLLQREYYALIGPRKMGKSLITDRVTSRLSKKEKNRSLCIATLDCQRRNVLSTDDLLKTIAKSLGVKFTVQHDEDSRLADKILELISLRLKRHQGKIIFMVLDILGFPTHLARELLAAFRVCHDDALYEDKVTAVVTGSADFIAMVESETSPYRFAKKLSIEGADYQFAKDFFTGKLITDDIDKEAFDYLYKETNGSMILLKELAASLVQKHLYENKKFPILGLKTLQEAKKLVENYIENFMGQCLTIRMMLRDIENRESVFDIFVKILYAKTPGAIKLFTDMKCGLFGTPKMDGGSINSQMSPIPFLVGCGAVVRDDQYRAHISSPMLKRYQRRRCSWRLIADVYCKQNRWTLAWRKYSKCKMDDKYRVISGENRFNLNNILLDWENSMHLRALEGLQGLIEHFFNGVKHLLVFDQCGVWNISGEHPQPICEKCGSNNIEIANRYKDTEIDRNDKKPSIQLSQEQLAIVAIIPGSPPAIPKVLVVIQRSHVDREIDTSCFRIVEKSLKGFCTALVHSLRLEYERELRKVREAHLKTLDRIHLAMAKNPLNLNDVLDEACQSLIDEGYHRLLIFLVDSSRTKIQGTNERCRNGKLILDKEISYKLSETGDNIQTWVVENQKPYIIFDAAIDSMAKSDLAKLAQINGAGIVPMKVEGEVIGTLHFERGDQQPPGAEEMTLFDQFANQLAAAVKLGQRLAMLRDALHASDNPIIVHDVLRNVLFLNKKASKITNRKAGWQTKYINLDSFFKPNYEDEEHIQTYYKHRLKQVVESRKRLRQYWAPYDRNGVSAAAWLGSPLIDDRKEIIGTVERFQDISPMYDLLQTLDKSRREKDPRERGRVYLKLLQERGHKKGRLYIKETQKNGEELLKSFTAVGFIDPNLNRQFEEGNVCFPLNEKHKISWICIDEKMPLIFKHDPNLAKEKRTIRKETDVLGLPVQWVSQISKAEQLEKESGEVWIEIPLFKGSKCIGKMAVSPPKEFTPENWQYLRLFAQSAGLSIDSAICRKRDDEKIEHNMIVARMLSHRLNASIGRCLTICKELGEGVLPENDKMFHASLLANRFIGMQILIDYLLSEGKQVERQSPNKLNFYELLEELRRSIEFEIADWKDAGVKALVNWNCKIIIEGEPKEIKISGSKQLLLRAIENLAINAAEALRYPRKSGYIKIKYQLRSSTLEIDLSTDGPSISPTSHIYFIKKITESSGSLKEITQIKPPEERNQEQIQHHRLGLKISTWIIKGIHKGSIDLLSGPDESPHFLIKLPYN